ncbi:hypothetical protein [Terrisporobacter sp.]|uniref:hypothetical protein n=1 Tax=Terrisporobacter sp. TaxID=1965305 RepID=UPI00289C8273|nr:hypothetical protein [Terrisporobacter sp.]
MNNNHLKFRCFLNKQRETKFSSKHEDVDVWLTDMRFKPFNFCDEMCYKRYFVYNGVQYMITISCFVENKLTVYIKNCENGEGYESNIEFDENESRIIKLGDVFTKGLSHFNIEISDINDYMYKSSK